MDYGRLITRSLEITWRHKWLWLLALFAGESSGSPSYSGQGLSNALGGGGGGGGQVKQYPNFAPFLTWIQDHLGLLVVGAIVLLVVYIVLFLVSCGAEAAVVRSAEAADRDEAITLGRAISLGMERLWVVVRLRLVLFLAGLAVLLVVGSLIGLIVLSFAVHAYLAAAVLIIATVGAGLLLILAAVAVPTFTRLSLRAAILDRTGAVDAIRAALALIWRRPGQVIVLWAIELAVSLGLALALIVVVLAVAAPALVIGYAAFNSASSSAAVVGLVAIGVLLFVILLVLGAAISAYLSVYWTLGYRQLQRA
jgi:hypothetical protein